MSGRVWLMVLLAAVLLVGWSSFFIVDERELVLVTQFGKYKRKVMYPGGYFKLPLEREPVEIYAKVLSPTAEGAVSVRLRTEEDLGAKPVKEFIKMAKEAIEAYVESLVARGEVIP